MDITLGGELTIKEPVKAPACPFCHKPGQKVNIKTVHSLLKEEIAKHLPEAEYFICLTPDCSVSYYTQTGANFHKDDLTVPIWFKEASPVPICYCKDVTDQDILDHVVNRQCCANLEDIQVHTGANTGKECLTKNPTGK